LLRHDPRRIEAGESPLHLDSAEPSIPYRDYAATETRFSVLWRTHPEEAERLLREAQSDVEARFRFYQRNAMQPGESSAQTEARKP
jgi:pyruvate-ferredoxin/flavodoxin oxidoreductase